MQENIYLDHTVLINVLKFTLLLVSNASIGVIISAVVVLPARFIIAGGPQKRIMMKTLRSDAIERLSKKLADAEEQENYFRNTYGAEEVQWNIGYSDGLRVALNLITAHSQKDK